MQSVTVTSQNPQVVEYKWRPEAVWSDGAPVGCKDMYLLYLAAVSPVKDGDAQIFDSSPTGYDQISKIDCSADQKTVTVTFATPFADYRGLWSAAGQAGSEMLPAHILEQRTGIADITKVDPRVDTPQLRAAGTFFTTGWNGFDPAVALSAGPFRIESSVRNAETVLVRNEKWWGNPAGPAKVTITAVTDSQANVQKLLNKEVQVIAPQAESAVSEQIRAQGGDYTMYAAGGQTYEHIDFNMARPLFADHPELRKAVATCLNRQRLLDNLIRSVDPDAVPLGNFIFQPNEAGYEDHYAQYGTGDVAGAKKLMDDAGWTLGRRRDLHQGRPAGQLRDRPQARRPPHPDRPAGHRRLQARRHRDPRRPGRRLQRPAAARGRLRRRPVRLGRRPGEVVADRQLLEQVGRAAPRTTTATATRRSTSCSSRATRSWTSPSG